MVNDQPISNQVKADPEKDDAAKLVNERYDQGKAAWRSWFQKMRLSLHYYLGDQYAYLDQETYDLSSPTSPEIRAAQKKRKMVLVKRNKLMPAVDVLVSRMTQRQPGLTAAPLKNDQAAKDKAKGCQDALRYFRLHKEYLTNDERNARWCVICGKGYKWVHPTPAPAEYMDLNGEQHPLPRSYEVQVSTLAPFQVIRPPRIVEIDKCPWIIVQQICDPAEIKLRYPTYEYDAEKDQSREAGPDELTDALLLTGEKIGNARFLKEYLELPSENNPRGKHIVVVDDQVLVNDEFPNWDEQEREIENPLAAMDPAAAPTVKMKTRRCAGYRMTEFSFRETLLSPASLGLVYPLVDLQRKLNLLYSQWHTNRVLSFAHKLKMGKGQKLPSDFWENYPSAVEWDQNKGPLEWMTPAQTPQDLDKLIDRDERAFDEESGVHPLTLGNEPLQRSPYLAIQHIITVDMDKFTPLFNRYGETEARTANNIISAVKQFCPTLFYYVIGEDKQVIAHEIQTDDLGDNEIIFERGSTIPESQAGRVADLLDLSKQGVVQLTGKAVMISYMRAVDTSWSRTFIEPMQAPLATAEAENRMLLAGQEVPVSIFHDDELHLFGHLPLYDSPESIGRISPNIERHLMAHNQNLAAKQGKGAPAPGDQPPGAGAGPGPEAALQGLQPPGMEPGGSMVMPPLEMADGGGPAMGAMQ